MATGIPYVDEGWGLFVGCTKIETGCVHCWANDLHAKRHKAYKAGRKMPRQYARPFWTVQFLPERLDQPARWRKPRDIFVCPMSDFFHANISPCDRARAIRAMEAVPRHRYFIFTKRIERAQVFFSTFATQLPNLWLMLSLSTQEEADRKISLLLNTNVAHKGLSLEPLLEEVNVRKIICQEHEIEWVICGCERLAGNKAGRFCEDEQRWWKAARWMIEGCRERGVPCFFKQGPLNGKVVTDPKDFPEDLRIREMPR